MRLCSTFASGEQSAPTAARSRLLAATKSLGDFAARAARTALLLALIAGQAPTQAQEQPEYRLKTAILYNFLLYTEWPSPPAQMLLCIVGRDPFGTEVEVLAGKPVGQRTIAIARKSPGDALHGCQVAYISPSAMPGLPRLLESLRGHPVLTVADTPGAAAQGVALNMALTQDRVTFEANTAAARAAGLTLSSKLLRFAIEVYQ